MAAVGKYRVLEADAKKVGLTVTEQEIQNVLNDGTSPMLAQTPFVNQQTGRFDVNALKHSLMGIIRLKLQSRSNSISCSRSMIIGSL